MSPHYLTGFLKTLILCKAAMKPDLLSIGAENVCLQVYTSASVANNIRHT